jgi:hypothetical protein
LRNTKFALGDIASNADLASVLIEGLAVGWNAFAAVKGVARLAVDTVPVLREIAIEAYLAGSVEVELQAVGGLAYVVSG